MTTEAANYAYNLDNGWLAVLLADYQREVKGHHTPSVKSVKQVASYLGHRQRFRSKYGLICVDETIEQIAQATALMKDAVSDALRFMDTVGITKTIKRGGGRNKLPTVRMLVTNGANPERSSDELTGRTPNDPDELTGESIRTHGGIDRTHGGIPPNTNICQEELPRRITNSSNITQSNSRCAGDVATKSIDPILARDLSPMPDEVLEQVRQFRLELHKPRTNNGVQPSWK